MGCISKILSSPRTVFLKRYIVPWQDISVYLYTPHQHLYDDATAVSYGRSVTLRVLRFIWVRSTAASTPLLSRYCHNKILNCYPILIVYNKEVVIRLSRSVVRLSQIRPSQLSCSNRGMLSVPFVQFTE